MPAVIGQLPILGELWTITTYKKVGFCALPSSLKPTSLPTASPSALPTGQPTKLNRFLDKKVVEHIIKELDGGGIRASDGGATGVNEPIKEGNENESDGDTNEQTLSLYDGVNVTTSSPSS